VTKSVQFVHLHSCKASLNKANQSCLQNASAVVCLSVAAVQLGVLQYKVLLLVPRGSQLITQKGFKQGRSREDWYSEEVRCLSSTSHAPLKKTSGCIILTPILALAAKGLCEVCLCREEEKLSCLQLSPL
jgi:hypothetical protein